MRARSIRLSILILVILALGVISLGFRDINVNIPGFPALERGGTGPLGLKLGLDLRGGGHLVYQADTGTRVDVSFPAQAVSSTSPGRGDTISGPGTYETADSGPENRRHTPSKLSLQGCIGLVSLRFSVGRAKQSGFGIVSLQYSVVFSPKNIFASV